MRTTSRVSAAAITSGIILFGLLCANPGILPVVISSQNHSLVLWPHPIWLALIATASLVPAFLARQIVRNVDSVFSPLAFLPLCFIGYFSQPVIPQPAAADLLFFGVIFLISASLFRWMRRHGEKQDEAPISKRDVWVAGIVFGILFTLIGGYFTLSVGEHSGDEGHYIIQAKCLYHEHGLDLHKSFASMSRDQILNQHISIRSRNGHWYSWHSFGLSALLAPFVPLGIWARHFVLGCLSGLCCAGILELCRVFRARRSWSWLALLLFSLSSFWGVYSSRCLPEVAGAAMTVWAVVAILRQPEMRWPSVWLCVVTCASLQWLHTRFLPASFALAGLYGLTGLFGGENLRRKILRLSIFSVAFVIATACFFAVQFTMFEGGMPLSANEILFSFPPGMWLVIASDHGILIVLPLFAWLLASAFWILFADTENRLKAALPLLLLSMVIVISCATIFFNGGHCMPGRYLLFVLPLFVPCAACALEKTNSTARWWFILLGLVSCADFALLLAWLPHSGKWFGLPHYAISRMYDCLHGLFNPADSWPEDLWRAQGILLLLATGILLFLPARRVALRYALPLAAICGSILSNPGRFSSAATDYSPADTARRLEEMGRSISTAPIFESGRISADDLFSISDRFHDIAIPTVTTRETAAQKKDRVIFLPRLQPNDWANRGFTWATLVSPFKTGAGPRCCRLTGRFEGDAKIFWAVRQGPRTIFEQELHPAADGRVEAATNFDCPGRGDVYLLLRLEGRDATLTNIRLAWSPYSGVLIALERECRQ